jgi:hypothetical protein
MPMVGASFFGIPAACTYSIKEHQQNDKRCYIIVACMENHSSILIDNNQIAWRIH